MATKNWESTRLLQWSQVNFTQASRTQWSKYLPIRKGPDSDRLWGLADSQHCPHLGFGHELVHGAQGCLQLRVWADPPLSQEAQHQVPLPPAGGVDQGGPPDLLWLRAAAAGREPRLFDHPPSFRENCIRLQKQNREQNKVSWWKSFLQQLVKRNNKVRTFGQLPQILTKWFILFLIRFSRGEWKEGEREPSFPEFARWLISINVKTSNEHWQPISWRCR